MEELPNVRFVEPRVVRGRIRVTMLIPSVLLLASEEEWDAAIKKAAERDIKPI